MGRNENVTFTAHIDTAEGFQFAVRVKNKDGCAFISGKLWKEFARIYQLEVGQQIYLNVDTNAETTRVTTRKLPITHPRNDSNYFACFYDYIVHNIPLSCKLKIYIFFHFDMAVYYHFSREKREIVTICRPLKEHLSIGG